MLLAKLLKHRLQANLDSSDDSYEIEVEIINDVPEKDRNRIPSTPPEDVTDEELENYSDKVRNRIRHFSKGITMNGGLKKLLKDRRESWRLAQNFWMRIKN